MLTTRRVCETCCSSSPVNSNGFNLGRLVNGLFSTEGGFVYNPKANAFAISYSWRMNKVIALRFKLSSSNIVKISDPGFCNSSYRNIIIQQAFSDGLVLFTANLTFKTPSVNPEEFEVVVLVKGNSLLTKFRRLVPHVVFFCLQVHG